MHHTFRTWILQERIANAAVSISNDNVVEYNGSVVLNCSVTGTPETIQWFKDGNALSINSRIALTQNDQTLTISNVSRDDDGNYRCNASNPISFSASNSQRLTVYYGPDLPQITISDRLLAQAGSNVTLNCNAASNPVPQYSWQLNGTTLSSTAQCVIYNISLSDEGNYTCVATNNRTNRVNSASKYIVVTAGPGSNDPPATGLKAGDIAGITVGTVAGVALILTLVVVLLKKLRWSNNEERSNNNDAKTYENVYISNGLSTYENITPGPPHQGIPGGPMESPASVYTDLQYHNESTYGELQRP